MFISGTKRPMTLGSIVDMDPNHFAQMMILGWPWPTEWQGQIWFIMYSYGTNLEELIFL